MLDTIASTRRSRLPHEGSLGNLPWLGWPDCLALLDMRRWNAFPGRLIKVRPPEELETLHPLPEAACVLHKCIIFCDAPGFRVTPKCRMCSSGIGVWLQTTAACEHVHEVVDSVLNRSSHQETRCTSYRRALQCTRASERCRARWGSWATGQTSSGATTSADESPQDRTRCRECCRKGSTIGRTWRQPERIRMRETSIRACPRSRASCRPRPVRTLAPAHQHP